MTSPTERFDLREALRKRARVALEDSHWALLIGLCRALDEIDHAEDLELLREIKDDLPVLQAVQAEGSTETVLQALRERTVAVPMVGPTRDERPGKTVHVTEYLPPIWNCDDLKIHGEHRWEEQTESGIRQYRCLGRTVALGRDLEPVEPDPIATQPEGGTVTHLHGTTEPFNLDEAHAGGQEPGQLTKCAECGGNARHVDGEGPFGGGLVHVDHQGRTLLISSHQARL